MKKIILHIIILTFFISCKESKLKSQENRTSKETIEDNFNDVKTLESSKFVGLKKDPLISLKKKKGININTPLKQELIGLGIKDSLSTNTYEWNSHSR